MSRASQKRMKMGARMIALSENRLTRKGLTVSRLSGPPRLNRTTAVLMRRE